MRLWLLVQALMWWPILGAAVWSLGGPERRARVAAATIGLMVASYVALARKEGGEVRERQTAELAQWLSARQPGAALVLVTHQVNISGLTGKYASSGEIVVVDVDVSDGVEVLGSIPAL